MGYVFLIVILLIFTAFLIYRERFVFFKKNKQLLDTINNIEGIRCFEHVWCSFSSLKIISSGFFAKVCFIPQGIVLIDDYTLDLNKNREKYASTYLIVKPKGKPKIDKHLFRNMAFIQEWSISEDGKLKLRIQNFQQSAFKAIGFFPTSYYLNVVLSLPLKKKEVSSLLKSVEMDV